MDMQEFIFTREDFQNKYQQLTASVRCECQFTTELIGGKPADRVGVERFVEHQLKLTGEEAKLAADRILKEEIFQEKSITPTGGEIEEVYSYGVKILHRSEHGPWLGNWQIKACLKQAASRLNIFVEQRGSKGNLSEAGLVAAWGDSLQEKDKPERIYLRNGKAMAQSYWQQFQGRVQSPRGAASIVHDSECIPAGTRFSFEYRFLVGKLSVAQIQEILSLAMVCGLGSSKTYERGKWAVEKCIITLPATEKGKAAKA